MNTAGPSSFSACAKRSVAEDCASPDRPGGVIGTAGAAVVSISADSPVMSWVMRSRAAIVREVGGAWSVEEFEPRSAPRRRGAGRDGRRRALPFRRTHPQRLHGPARRAPKTRPPTIGGHEGSGVVVEVGDNVAGLAPGDHVVTSFVAVCGHCRWCASGMEYLCDKGAGVLIPGMPTDGTFRHHTVDGHDLGHTSKIGAFAEHTVVAADSLVKIDPAVPLVPAALLSCAIPTGYGSAAHRGEVRPGTPWSSSGSAASAPPPYRARGSPVPRRSSPWIPLQPNATRPSASARRTARPRQPRRPTWSETSPVA